MSKTNPLNLGLFGNILRISKWFMWYICFLLKQNHQNTCTTNLVHMILDQLLVWAYTEPILMVIGRSVNLHCHTYL